MNWIHSKHILAITNRLRLQRSRSTTASIADLPIPKSIREALKSSFLNEATKLNSTFWSNKFNGYCMNPQLQDHQHLQQPQQVKLEHSVESNGAYLHHNLNSIQQATTHGLDDPLEEWYIHNEPRYWPELPTEVGPADPFALAKAEIESLSRTIREDLLGTDHPVLNQAASYFFHADDSGGKKVRPMMVLLLSRALADHAGASSPSISNATCSNSSSSVSSSPLSSSSSSSSTLWSNPLPWQRPDLPQAQRRLAEISELIHTASLFHDDVIDQAETRRGKPAVHKAFGNKMAILAGDYLLARASISLARLRQVDVVECMSTIIEHLVRGEVMQMKGSSLTESRLTYYLRKNFFKTGSLMANSCRSAALLGGYSHESVECSYLYGKHIGMAFQLVDDVLDFSGSAETMGKPALSDLNAGLATAPVLFALESQTDNVLQTMINRKFREDGDVDKTVELVFASNGIEKTKELAQVHAELAMDAVLLLNPSPYRDALVHLAYKVVERTR